MGFFAAMMISCIVNGGDTAFMLYTVENYGDLCASFLLAIAALPRFRKELLQGVVFVAGIYTVLNLIVLLFVPIGDGALRSSATERVFVGSTSRQLRLPFFLTRTAKNPARFVLSYCISPLLLNL